MLDLNDIVVVDSETTGVSQFEHDALSFYFHPMKEGVEPLQLYIKYDEVKWQGWPLNNFFNFKDEYQKHAVRRGDAVWAFVEWRKKNYGSNSIMLAGHNVGFDFSFLQKLFWAAKVDGPAFVKHRLLDTHSMLLRLHKRGIIPEEATTSGGAFKHFGIEVPEEKRHTAEGDCVATAQLIRLLLRADSTVPVSVPV